jgi:hypothetical protein
MAWELSLEMPFLWERKYDVFCFVHIDRVAFDDKIMYKTFVRCLWKERAL